METEELVDEILSTLPELVHQLKSSAVEICAQLPTDIAEGYPFGASIARIRAVIFLFQHGRSSVGEVAAGLGVTIGTASQLLDRLVDEGWVERGSNPDDRRQVLVWLTPRAETIAGRIHEVRRAQVRSTLAKLGSGEGEVLLRALRAFVDSLQEPIPDSSGAINQALRPAS